MEIYSAGRSVCGAVKLSSNENPLGPSSKAIEAIHAALPNIHRYPDGAASALRTALAELWQTKKENLIIANGSDEVLSLLAAAWLSPGENAVGCRETFSQYRYAVNLFGAEMRESHLKEGYFDLDAMAALVDSKTRMIFICNPNNPSGTYCSESDLVRFLEHVPSEIIVVLDEAYADFADASDFPDSKHLLAQYNNLVVMRTFSKLYGLAGLRVGYAVGDTEIISGAARAAMPFNVNSLAQIGALAALDDTEHRRVSLDLVRDERAFMSEKLVERDIFFYPSQANFVCMDMNCKVQNIWHSIAQAGIVVRDLSSFGLPSMIRYTCGIRENNERFLQILDDLALF